MKSGSGNNLLALGSAAVVAVYAAGYMRTKPAADRLEAQSAGRRPSPGAAALPRNVPAAAERALDPAASGAPSAALSAAAVANAATVAAAVPARDSASDGTDHPSNTTPMSDAASAASDLPAAVSAKTLAPKSAKANTAKASIASADSVASAASSTSATASTSAAVATATPPAVVVDTPAVAPPAAATSAPKAAAYRDGAFWGRGSSRHGDIVATVEIKDGRIVSAVISQCLTRYSCSWISALPAQVVARQSPDVDTVSGATQSADAFYWAIVQALSQAK